MMSRGVSGSPIAGLVLGGLRALLLVTAFLVAATASAQEPLAIHYEYQLDDGVGEGQRETLERALGIVAGFLNDTFVVRRPDDESSLLLEPTCMKWRTISYPGGGGSRDECVEYSTACGKARPPPSLFRAREVCDERRVGDCEVVGEGNQGVPGAQLVVYLTAVDGPGCSSGSEVSPLLLLLAVLLASDLALLLAGRGARQRDALHAERHRREAHQRERERVPRDDPARL